MAFSGAATNQTKLDGISSLHSLTSKLRLHTNSSRAETESLRMRASELEKQVSELRSQNERILRLIDERLLAEQQPEKV
uniref:hypothetical protein n=1 Tax=Microcystis aeruginosa TaxID=1126 RepID=UPI001866EFED|nr:hypothetical protein [Microcystis aeruginosa]